MTRWIALFRGINVGGKNLLKMAELRRGLAEIGFEDVQTYIQSGNVILDAKSKSATSVAKKIAGHVEEAHGFRPAVMVLSPEDVQAAKDANPFPQAEVDPKTLHFFFLERTAAKPDWEAIKKAQAASEDYHLTDRLFYLYAPDGIARSKLAANAEKYLGVTTTARNLRTVEKILALT